VVRAEVTGGSIRQLARSAILLLDSRRSCVQWNEGRFFRFMPSFKSDTILARCFIGEI
jgi:hypothetical protein